MCEQFYAESRTGAESGIYGNLAAMELCEVFDDREAQARAADLTRTSAIRTIKSLENPLFMLR